MDTLRGRFVDLDLVGVVKTLPCLAHAGVGGDCHHVISQGAGGDDYFWNLMPLCRQSHSECHQIGLTAFAEKYGAVKLWLLGSDWYFDSVSNKWRHDR